MSADVVSIGNFLSNSLSSLTEKSEAFQTRMSEMSAKEGGITQEDLLQLQFEMGQFSALTESIANITKSLNDTLKSLAQKT